MTVHRPRFHLLVVTGLLWVALPVSAPAQQYDDLFMSMMLTDARILLGKGDCDSALRTLDEADFPPAIARRNAMAAGGVAAGVDPDRIVGSLRLAPLHLRFYLLRSEALGCLGRTAEALEILDRLITSPGGKLLVRDAATDEVAMHATIMAGRAKLYIQDGNAFAALATAETATMLGPELPNGHLWRGMALEALGQDAKAVAAYRAVLRHSTEGQRNPAWVAHAEERIRALEGRHGVQGIW